MKLAEHAVDSLHRAEIRSIRATLLRIGKPRVRFEITDALAIDRFKNSLAAASRGSCYMFDPAIPRFVLRLTIVGRTDDELLEVQPHYVLQGAESWFTPRREPWLWLCEHAGVPV